MGLNTCAALANKTVEIPDGCGKLSKTGIRANWLLVRAIYEWLKGFLTFSVPDSMPRVYTFILTGQTFVDIPFVDVITGKTFAFPTDSMQYAFFDFYWNGPRYEGGYMVGGMDAMTHQIQWNGANFDATYYRISIYDETGAPKPMGTAEQPCTVSVKFWPSLLIGSNFCTTNGTVPTNAAPCGC